jgi:hypothetical protein
VPDLVVLHEHPEWQRPLYAALERRGVLYAPFDVTSGDRRELFYLAG